MAMRDVAISSFKLNLTHDRIKQDALVKLNSIANHYVKPETNDFSIVKERNKIDNLRDIHFKIFTPSTEQLHYLKGMREEFGVDCYIPNVSFDIRLGMKPNIVRFKKINDNEIWGLPDKLERDILVGRLASGLKIVDIPFEEDESIKLLAQETSYVYQLEKKVEKLEAALENEEDERKDDIRKLTKDKADLLEKLKLADARLRETAQRAHECQEELKKRQPGSPEDAQKIKDLEQKAQDLQTKLNVEGNRYSQIFDQFEQCKRDRETLTTKKEELEGKTLELGRKVTELEDELDKCKKLKEGVRIVMKDPELNKCKQDLETATVKLIAANASLDLYRKQLKDKTSELTTQTNLANLYRQEKEELHKKLVACETKIVVPKDKECANPDYAEYNQKYRQLPADE